MCRFRHNMLEGKVGISLIPIPSQKTEPPYARARNLRHYIIGTAVPLCAKILDIFCHGEGTISDQVSHNKNHLGTGTMFRL